jgi:cell division ATPase FtsA
MSNSSPQKGGAAIYSRRKIQRIIAARAPEILDALFEALQSKNASLKLGAAKILINKVLPDLKATELKAEDGKSLVGLITIKYEGDHPKPLADQSQS